MPNTEYVTQQSAFGNPLGPVPGFQDPLLYKQSFSNDGLPPAGAIPSVDNFFLDQLPLPSYDNAVIALGLEGVEPSPGCFGSCLQSFVENN